MTQVTEKSSDEAAGLDDVERNQTSQAIAQTSLPPPNGGIQAWLVVTGAFCALVCTFGYLNSFG